MTTKTKIRARRMFTVTGKDSTELHGSLEDAKFHQQMNEDMDLGPYMIEPVFALPADDASVEAMVEQAHDAVLNEFTSKRGKPGLKDYSDAVLSSLGLTRNKGTRPEKKL